MAALDRRADSIRAELDAARLAGPAYWAIRPKHENDLLVRERGRPAAEYELLLRWLEERLRVGHPPQAVRMGAGWHLDVHALRSMALYRLGRYAEALEEIGHVGKDDDEGQMNVEEQQLIRALCLVALGQTAAARAAFAASQSGNDADGPYSPSPYIDESGDLQPLLHLLKGADAVQKP